VRLRWFRVEEDNPSHFYACFEHKNKPYIGDFIQSEDVDVFENIDDALARCWDIAWGKVKKDGNE